MSGATPKTNKSDIHTKENIMSDFIIEDYTPAVAENPHAPAVDALVKAGPGKQLTITVPRGTKRDSDLPGEGQKDRLAFQQAANAAGYTARVVGEDYISDEQVKLTFILTAKNKRAGKPRGSAAETAAETAPAAPVETEAETVESEPETRKRGR